MRTPRGQAPINWKESFNGRPSNDLEDSSAGVESKRPYGKTVSVTTTSGAFAPSKVPCKVDCAAIDARSKILLLLPRLQPNQMTVRTPLPE